jgi:soluble lytic murein transglycosylase-like protein
LRVVITARVRKVSRPGAAKADSPIDHPDDREAVLKPASLITATAAAALALSAPAGAAVPHTVEPGETLWSIAAASNLTTRALAASNGLSETSNVVIGTTIEIPSEYEAAAALGGQPPAQGGSGAAPVASGSSSSSGAPEALGAYTVRPGDTLTGIASRSGASAQQIAWMNGIDANAPLLYGTALKLPNGAPGAGASQPPPQRVVAAAPNPSPARTDSGTIGQIAAEHGVPGSLASAIAWQESGFNNGMVSSANARGVMQVMPGTWDWVQHNLAGQALDPNSANDNVRAGVLYLGQLLRDTGGDPRQAVAAYYQGLGSVQQSGMYPETERYVNNVMALRSRFGG